MSADELREGMRVRFTHGPLGLLESPDAFKFAEPVVGAGDFGTYVGAHATLDDWHIIRVILPGYPDLYAPVHRGQFEVAS